MRGDRAGRAALVPAPGLGHVRRRLCLVPSCWPPWSLWVGSLLPLNCLGRAPAAPLAPTHALAGPFVVPSAPAALPSFSVGFTNPVRVSLALGPDVIWTASLTLLRPLWWVPPLAFSDEFFVLGKNNSNRPCDKFIHRPLSFRSQPPVPKRQH